MIRMMPTPSVSTMSDEISRNLATLKCYLYTETETRQNRRHFTFSNAFYWMEIFEFWIKFHWTLFLGFQLTIFKHWFSQYRGAGQATNHYLNQWWLVYRRIYGIYRRHFANDIFKCILLNGNIWILNKISLNIVPRVPINNIQALVQSISWRRSGDKPLSEPMMVSLPTQICVLRPQWIKLVIAETQQCPWLCTLLYIYIYM